MPFPSASPYRCWPAERGRRWPALPTGWLGRSRRNSFSPSCINPAGSITGYYCDATNCHGFLRTPGGTITSFDIPGDANGTYPPGLTPAGASEGNYIDASAVNRGFFGVPGGTFNTFDVQGAGTGSGQGTIPFVNDPSNAITGYYVDSSNVSCGFLRTH